MAASAMATVTQVRQPVELDDLPVTAADREMGHGGPVARGLTEQAQARGQPQPLRGTLIEVCVSAHIGYSDPVGCRIGGFAANLRPG
jgi:hypothetical protein